MDGKVKRIPIARCPNPDCSRTLLFSCDPKDRLHITTKIADERYQEKNDDMFAVQNHRSHH